MTASQDITALLGSRICHDLISPLGAISNGVELLEMTGLEMGPELELISQSVSNANARIRFFRVAFGASSPDQMIGANEIRSILADQTKTGRLHIDWQVGSDMERQQVKMMFLLLMCLETSMPWGGQITASHDGSYWSLAGTSDRMKDVPELWDLLSRPPGTPEIAAADVHFLLLAHLLQEVGRNLTLDRSETGLIARF
jgi:histidine phosphotransferase ChpT